MAEHIDSDQIAEFKECFNLYDRDGDGLISTEQMKVVMRSLGQCPSQRELEDIVKVLGKQKINFPDFLDIMWQMMQKSQNPESDIFEAFKVYDDKKQGVVSMKDLRHILMRTGEKLNPQEFDYMLKEAGINKNSNHVKYSDLARAFNHV